MIRSTKLRTSFDEVRKKKTIDYIFGEKHRDYMRNTRYNDFNFAEGAVRAGKTIDNVVSFCVELMTTPDKIHLATGSTEGNAKLNLGDANGFGMEHFFRGQCKWGKYKGMESLTIKGKMTGNKTKIIIFAGGGKKDSYKKIRGNSYGMWIATEINLHAKDTVEEAFNRLVASKNKKVFWDLNPDNPEHWIYTDYIDKYRENEEMRVNYQHFTLFDNASLTEKQIRDTVVQYEPGSIWYRRYIDGERMRVEGLIYQYFTEHQSSLLMEYEDIPPLQYISIGVDIGGSGSKHALVASGISYKNELIVLASERVEPNRTVDFLNVFLEFVIMVMTKYDKTPNRDGIIAIFFESAEQILRRDCQDILLENNINISVLNSIKGPIIDRIRLSNSLAYQRRLYYTRDSETFRKAMTSAVWKENNTTENIRLDDGTSDIDTLDAYEYSFERFMNLLQAIKE